MKNEIVVSNKNAVHPFERFNETAMQKFYDTKKFLCSFDATELLDKCIAEVNEETKYDGTYQKVHDPHYVTNSLGFIISSEREYRYIPNYTVKREVLISTSLFINKLDIALYFWRELNPTLLQLLSSKEYVEKAIIANWVQMISYMAPPSLQNAQS